MSYFQHVLEGMWEGVPEKDTLVYSSHIKVQTFTKKKKITLTFLLTQMCTELVVNLIFFGGAAGKPGGLEASLSLWKVAKLRRYTHTNPPLCRTHMSSVSNKHKQLHTITQPTENFRSDINPISPAYQGWSSAPQHSCSLHLPANPFPLLASFLTPAQQSRVMTILF